MLIGLAAVLLLGVAWLFMVNLRSKEVKARYAKMGEELSIDALVPKVGPSQSNGAK